MFHCASSLNSGGLSLIHQVFLFSRGHSGHHFLEEVKKIESGQISTGQSATILSICMICLPAETIGVQSTLAEEGADEH